MDKIDLKILSILQRDAATPLARIAEMVNLSTTPCWRRIEALRRDGVIVGQVALIDPSKVNLGVTVFVTIKTNRHQQEWLEVFARGVSEMPEVMEVYRMSGDIDYLLRVVVPSIEGYDAFYKKLIKVCDLYDVSSSFAMEQIKYTTALPLQAAP